MFPSVTSSHVLATVVWIKEEHLIQNLSIRILSWQLETKGIYELSLSDTLNWEVNQGKSVNLWPFLLYPDYRKEKSVCSKNAWWCMRLYVQFFQIPSSILALVSTNLCHFHLSYFKYNCVINTNNISKNRWMHTMVVKKYYETVTYYFIWKSS